ncbi:MAG: hypothetical protein LBI36_00025 [Oscillospiraceae bacterium]|nr:hypothetical protein [Oscillospiraceae bacterium]
MDFTPGAFYFLKDSFFEKVNERFLKCNYETTKRPHYFAFKDDNTSLYWLVPCSSRTEKFERIIKDKKECNKPTDGIKIVRVRDRKQVLLFQDMFPTTVDYIKNPYVKDGQLVRIESQALVAELNKNANNVRIKLLKGVKFTPTQPNVQRIEKLMLAELARQPLPPPQK